MTAQVPLYSLEYGSPFQYAGTVYEKGTQRFRAGKPVKDVGCFRVGHHHTDRLDYDTMVTPLVPVPVAEDRSQNHALRQAVEKMVRNVKFMNNRIVSVSRRTFDELRRALEAPE